MIRHRIIGLLNLAGVMYGAHLTSLDAWWALVSGIGLIVVNTPLGVLYLFGQKGSDNEDSNHNGT